VDNPFHFYPTPFHKNKNIGLEKDILVHAEKVFVTTRYAKELMLKRYRFLSHEDIMILPHGYDPEDFDSVSAIEKKPDKFVITHSGLFQDNRTPKHFLNALASYFARNAEARALIEIRFVGLMRQSHLKLIKKLGLEKNVLCTGYVPHIEAIRHLLESDVLWLMLKDTIRTPGKLYEYFGARKPILACLPDGIMKSTALESGAAIATGPTDEKAIEKAISKMFRLWQSGKLPSPDEDFVKGFDRKYLTTILAREIALAAEMS
jgi:glycosyltransferase involved in cell wall biosynthesis